MWEKWVFIASAAGLTCLMRATIADIIQAGAKDLATSILEDCAAIAKANGFAVHQASMEKFRAALTNPDSLLTASMLKDLERKAVNEAEHTIGNMIAHEIAQAPASPLLHVIHAHLKSYETRPVRGSLS